MLTNELSMFIKQLNECVRQADHAQWAESVCFLYRSYTGYGVKLTLANGETVAEVLPESVNEETELSVIITLPIIRNEKQIGTLQLTGFSQKPIEENDRLAAEILQALFTVMLHMNAHKGLEAVRSAVNSLSFSELEAAVQIAKRLKNNEGLIVAAKVSGEIKITRPVIVNALRKLEGAGMIETRSLGMKGTYIKIKNELLAAELRKL